MAADVITVDQLSKKYHVRKVVKQNRTIQEKAISSLVAPFRRISNLLRGNAAAAADLDEEFWALQDVSFSVGQGEVVAIIGRNGAGKSTLLKLLSRITEPTSGSATIRGRVGSLLEVGTGFHPELSGRENVYLNGSILGMKRSEIARKFDAIVAFSEIGKFIDTPVKHYSSGMRVRLAFSVAAHLEPEVMFVDEVLAVGDAAFRKKCLEKVKSVAAGGSTVLVVSHNAQQVTSICSRAIWLANGTVVDDGDASTVVTKYLSQSIGLGGERVWAKDDPKSGNATARVVAMRIRNERGEVTNTIDVRERFCIETELDVLQEGKSLVLKYDVFNSDYAGVFASLDTNNPTWRNDTWPKGRATLRMWVPGNFLQVDTYPINAILWVWDKDKHVAWSQTDALCVHIMDYLEGPTAAAGLLTGVWPGSIRPVMEWEMETADTALPRLNGRSFNAS
ncbi:MAG: ATP-binding cassette domain-containing protein [Pseudomonadales bacterium]|nr:ATP-binding cassette domain-containing protein [Pseudomonadales bacterium]